MEQTCARVDGLMACTDWHRATAKNEGCQVQTLYLVTEPTTPFSVVFAEDDGVQRTCNEVWVHWTGLVFKSDSKTAHPAVPMGTTDVQ